MNHAVPVSRLQMALETVPCPVCGGSHFAVLAHSDRYDMDLSTVGCKGCGLVLTNPQPTEAWLDKFYEQDYRRYYDKNPVPHLDYIRQYRKDERSVVAARFFADCGVLKPGIRVLDIGGSEGCMLKAVKDAEASAQLFSVEPNPEFAEFSRHHAGCEVFSGFEGARQAGPFDLVIINHVLEHLKQPVAYLRSLRGVLAPEAHVYIDVPDISEYHLLKYLHIAHLYHFSQKSLTAVLAVAGYRVVSMEKHTPPGHQKSVRVLATPGTAPLAAAQPGDWQREWARVRRLDRKAVGYHKDRWPPARKLRHLARWALAGLRPPSLRGPG